MSEALPPDHHRDGGPRSGRLHRGQGPHRARRGRGIDIDHQRDHAKALLQKLAGDIGEELVAETVGAPQIDEAARGPLSEALDEVNYYFEEGHGTVQKIKKTQDGNRIVFKRETIIQGVFDCHETNKIDRIRSDGRWGVHRAFRNARSERRCRSATAR